MKKNRKDFIFDLETIGANVFHCPVVDVAYTTFEWDRFAEEPYTFEEVASTVQTVVEFCDTILAYLREQRNIDYWWSRGNTFDPVILNRLMLATDNMPTLDQYLKFYKVRDVRSHIDAKFDYTTRNGFVPVSDESYWSTAFIAHDSSHDVAADVMRLQTIYRAENDMEQTAR